MSLVLALLGAARAAVKIHGIGDCSAKWRELIPQLAQDHTVIAPDLLGHGCSAKRSGCSSGQSNAGRRAIGAGRAP
jgi:pimeloyl-ACP methyl ester carboxylesterase